MYDFSCFSIKSMVKLIYNKEANDETVKLLTTGERPPIVASKKDLEEIREWRRARGVPTPPNSALPTLGALVPGVAAGYLYLTDSSICLIEDYITNPDKSSKERNSALEFITDMLLELSQMCKFSQVVIFTEDASIMARAEAWGFAKKAQKTMMVKEIK